MGNMRLYKVIIVLISLLLTTSAMAGNKTPGDAKGHIGEMPPPIWLGDDVKYLSLIHISEPTRPY